MEHLRNFRNSWVQIINPTHIERWGDVHALQFGDDSCDMAGSQAASSCLTTCQKASEKARTGGPVADAEAKHLAY